MTAYRTMKDKFIFVPMLDEIGNDIGSPSGTNVDDLMQKALNTIGCAGFNTLGYLKSRISNLQPSRYFRENDGIYIMREDVRKSQTELLNKKHTLDFIMQNIDEYTDNTEVNESEVIDNSSLSRNTNESESTTSHVSETSVMEKGDVVEDVTEDVDDVTKCVFNNDVNQPQSPIFKPSPLDIHTIEKIFKEDALIMNDIFIETGSYTGDGIQAALNLGFKEIHSIELSEKYYELCKEKFKTYPQVTIHKGDSGVLLETLIKDKDEGITFWLDGHYSSGDTACAEKYCSPIQQELESIRKFSHPNHVILIDDMKDFTKESILFNYQQNGKCGYVEKFQLEQLLYAIFPTPKLYYFNPACVCYSKNKI